MTDLLTVSLEAVFDSIPVGLGVVDASSRIVLMNAAFRDSLGLPHDAFPAGTPVEEAVRASALRGVYGPGDPDAQVAAVMAADRSFSTVDIWWLPRLRSCPQPVMNRPGDRHTSHRAGLNRL